MATLGDTTRPSMVLDVPLIEWPAHEDRRRALATQGVPRLLLVAEGHPPPEHWDVLEDWVRAPADVAEVLARQATLRARVPRPPEPPSLDEHGLLWLGAHWVPIPPSQVGVVELLVERAGHLVGAGELRDAYARAGGNADSSAMKAVMVRVGRRINDVGLRLHNIRGRGYLLEVPDEVARTG